MQYSQVLLVERVHAKLVEELASVGYCCVPSGIHPFQYMQRTVKVYRIGADVSVLSSRLAVSDDSPFVVLVGLRDTEQRRISMRGFSVWRRSEYPDLYQFVYATIYSGDPQIVSAMDA